VSATRLDEATRMSLREKAEVVESLVERSVDERPSADEKLDARRQRRWTWYRSVEDALLDLVNMLPAGTEDYEARQLFLYLTELRRAIDADSKVTDEAGQVQLAAAKIFDVLRRLARRLEHSRLENVDEAARFVLGALDGVPVGELAGLLGVSTKTIGVWRAGKPVRQNAERVKLIAQLCSYLRYSMTATGLLMWFENPADRLGGRSPLQLVDDGISAAWEPLVAYARGGRGQLAD
jgi:hypothetical protein